MSQNAVIDNLLRNEIFMRCREAKEMGLDFVEFKTIWVAKKFRMLGIPVKSVNITWRYVVDGVCVKRKKRGVILVDCRCFTT